ncbi:hypothetical protein RD792_012736 [Penstemon davidsonii]|uniref:F-box domain-containing protein n=1 Tax=Penstemon davidsonii TaxID=160366 RepID=A0ABR0CYN1_9LAMI|nr:hypothetical protein RD792_012736 [Penstemon davidsonii]
MLSVLPDEMWRRILEIGIESKTLDYRSLCCLSISCRRLRSLAAEDSLWSNLLLTDFPSISNSDENKINCKFKSLYKISYEKDREQKRLAHRRAVLRIESEIAVHLKRIQEIKLQLSEEKEKMNKAIAELLNLRRVRQASAALEVWQPEIIRSRQKEMVQQCNVPVDFRINAVEMEISLCKQQIAGLDKALIVKKRTLAAAKEQLASVKYHPLQDFNSSSFQLNECRMRNKMLKHTSTVKF